MKSFGDLYEGSTRVLRDPAPRMPCGGSVEAEAQLQYSVACALLDA